MLGALVSFLIVMGIYAFIDFLKHKRPFKPNVYPHKRIGRYIWIYCVFLLGITITFISVGETRSLLRPVYGNYKGYYFPYGEFSNLRIGNIREKVSYNGRRRQNDCQVAMMHRVWSEIREAYPHEPYSTLFNSLYTYNDSIYSDTYGFGAILNVYDVSEDINAANGDEKTAYISLINKQVTDSSFFNVDNSFAPYQAISTQTYMTISTDNIDEPPLFKKHITLFANQRAYEFTFFVDEKLKLFHGQNAFDGLDDYFTNWAKDLDLNSYAQWKNSEESYNSSLLRYQCLLWGLYVFVIIGALIYPILYIRNRGNISPIFGKWCNWVGIFNIVTFILLGISFIGAFCTIKHEIITEQYQYRFESFIDDEMAATSVLCFLAYFLLLIIPQNYLFIRSYTASITKANSKTKPNGCIYWIVRPFVLLTKLFNRTSKSFKDEYHKQLADKN